MTNMNLNENYTPSDKEEYMNAKQLEYFKKKLLTWKNELMEETKVTLDHLKEEKLDEPDFVDNASIETDIETEVQIQDNHSKLIKKIDAALERIENKTYGYCEEYGEPIGLERLKASPIATLCRDAQERYEKQKNVQK